MALFTQFERLQQALLNLSPRSAPNADVDRQIAQQLISLLKPHVNIYKEMLEQSSISELPTTATLERLKADTKTRASNIPPDELGRILSLEVERQWLLKAKQDLEHIKNSPSIDPVLSTHLTTQIKRLETKATTLKDDIETKKRDVSIDANIATMNERIREAGLNTDIREQGSEQARLCLMNSPSYKRQLDAMTNTYNVVQPALEAVEALDSGATPEERAEAESKLSIALDEQLADDSDLAQALPMPSENESDAYRTIQQVHSLIPRFSVRNHVKEVRDSNLRDDEIPSELFELEARCNSLAGLADQHDTLYQEAHDEMTTTEARAKAKADIPAVQQKMAEEIKALNIFMRRHAKGALKAVDPTVMRDITQSHALLVDKFTKDHGLLLRDNKQTKLGQVGRLLASAYNFILQPTRIHSNIKAFKEDADDLLDNNNSRHLPRVSSQVTHDSRNITYDPNYLSKNANNTVYKTTVTFKGKTTDKNRQQRQQLSNLFNSTDFKLRPNPPNSNDPKAQQFSTRQVLINTFGQKWADKNIKTKANGDITILFDDNEASAIHQALSKANKEYTAWMKAQEPSKNLEASLTDTDNRPLTPTAPPKTSRPATPDSGRGPEDDSTIGLTAR